MVHRSSSKTGWTIAGAVNGSCCGGYTDSSGSVAYDDIGYEQWGSNSYTFNIQENGGVYYCASNMTDSGGDNQSEASSWSWSFYYASNNKYCMDQKPASPLICYCSEKGDPRKGTCCEGPC